MGQKHHPDFTCLLSFYGEQAEIKSLVYSPNLKIFEYMKLQYHISLTSFQCFSALFGKTDRWNVCDWNLIGFHGPAGSDHII
jgi:hypothetical protein